MSRKQGVVQDLIPVCLRPSVQQQINADITLAIECGEKEDEQTQYGTANGQFDIRLILKSRKHILTGTHHTNEVERHQTTADT